MKRALLLAIAFLSPGFAAPQPTRYFTDDTGRNPFLETWLGRQLSAMDEPVLSRSGDLAGFTRRLRMLVVPYRSPAYAVRIDMSSTGAQLTLVVLDRPSQSSRLRVAKRRLRPLSGRRLSSIVGALRSADLGRQPTSLPERPPRILPDGSQEIEMCVHSTLFLIEMLDGAGSHFVERDACNFTPALAALADALVSFRTDGGAANERAILAGQMRRR